MKMMPKRVTKIIEQTGEMLLVKFFCGVCRKQYKQFMDKARLRNWPAYVKFKGRRIETRLPDGVLMKACDDCMLRYSQTLPETRK